MAINRIPPADLASRLVATYHANMTCGKDLMRRPCRSGADLEIIRLSGWGALFWGRKVKMPTGMPLVFPAVMERYSERLPAT